MMQRSNEIDQLMAAIGKVQKDGVSIGKDTTGARAIKYASLGQILEVIQERCSKHELVLTQDEIVYESNPALLTMVFHTPSKQWKSGISLLTINTTNPNLDQAWGGSTTYHRRYCAMMSLGLCQDGDVNDNDGHNEAPQATNSNYASPKPTTAFASTGVVSEKQVGMLKWKIKESKQPNVMEHVQKMYGITDIAKLPFGKCNELIEWLGQTPQKSIIDEDELPF